MSSTIPRPLVLFILCAVGFVGLTVTLASALAHGSTISTPGLQLDAQQPPPDQPPPHERPGYKLVQDDTGTLQLSVPSTWVDVLGEPIMQDGQPIPDVIASPNAEGFQNEWVTQGVQFRASTQWAATFPTAEGLLQHLGSEMIGTNCTYIDRVPFQRPGYTGAADFYGSCPGGGFVTLAVAQPPDASYWAMLFIQSVQGYDALLTLFNSFEVNFEGRFVPPQPPGTIQPDGLIPDTTAAPINVDIVNFVLPDLQILQGTTVTWTNRDSAPHTATAGTPNSPSGAFDTGLLTQGQSSSITFPSPGTYPYFCMVHPAMQGVVTVAPSQAQQEGVTRPGPTPGISGQQDAEQLLGTYTGTVTTTITYSPSQVPLPWDPVNPEGPQTTQGNVRVVIGPPMVTGDTQAQRDLESETNPFNLSVEPVPGSNLLEIGQVTIISAASIRTQKTGRSLGLQYWELEVQGSGFAGRLTTLHQGAQFNWLQAYDRFIGMGMIFGLAEGTEITATLEGNTLTMQIEGNVTAGHLPFVAEIVAMRTAR